MIAVFLGVNLVYKEIEKKTIYTLASKPIPRWQLLLGKWLGLWLTLVVEIVILGAIFTVLIGAQQGGIRPVLYVPMLMLIFELTLITAWATLFSTFATPLLAAAYTISVYLIGHFVDDLALFGRQSESPGFREAMEVLYRVLPNLEMFNVRSAAVHALPIPASEVAWAALYALTYSVAVLSLAMVSFERRDFK